MTETFDHATIARFWSKVDRRGDDECWSWLGRRDKDGYGYFEIGRASGTKSRTWRAHRFAYVVTSGDLGNLKGLHTCDNPPCCNPRHLWRGTDKDNSDDKISKGRDPERFKGSTHANAKLNEQQVAEIRRALACGTTKADLAYRYGTSRVNVWFIETRRRWAHVA